MTSLKPGDEVYVKSWGYGNDPEEPARIISIGKPSKRGNINISWRDAYGETITAKSLGYLFHAHELRLYSAED